jgi:hypothetical protein
MVVGTPPFPLSLGSLQAIINEGGGLSFFGCLVLGFFYTKPFQDSKEVHTLLCLCFDSSSLNLGVHQTKASFIRMHDNEMNEWIK